MPLIRCEDLNIEFGDNAILENANFSIEEAERVCLIGRNGAGKSTLLKILDGSLIPDRGAIHRIEHLRISALSQDLPTPTQETVSEFVSRGLSKQIELLEHFQTLSSSASSRRELSQLDQLQKEIDAEGCWNPRQQVKAILSQLNIPQEALLENLSGGWRRRVSLARSLVTNPNLLLLDEPTNHLDFSTIEWLEHRVRSFKGAVIFITHDRALVDRLATRIVEIDRGQLISWPGNYQNYCQLREKANQEEDTENALFDKRLAREETWIREGIKARRTRNEGRVRALEQMRTQSEARIKRLKKASIDISEAEESGRKVVELRSVNMEFDGCTIIKNLNLKIMRGDRIGLIGNNGIGKSTLIKILLQKLEPTSGNVKLGTHLTIGYFDQIRDELDGEKTVAENVGNGKEYVKVNGKDRHIIGYLKNFMFSPSRSQSLVKYLSGGECNRLLLARLFTQANNFLILDEPTNDLDVEMLEVLEQRLVDYQGTLIIVSHDRQFIDNTVTSTLVFEEDFKITSYPGGYSDWERKGHKLANLLQGSADRLEHQSTSSETNQLSNDKEAQSLSQKPARPSATQSKQPLSYKYQRELDQLPDVIQSLEQEIETLQSEMSSAFFNSQPFSEQSPALAKLQKLQEELDRHTERWFELEEMATG